MKIEKKKGFTLIELLVVIAIIGVISSVVLVSLNTAREKSANSAIKANLSNLRAAAELFYDIPNSYSMFCNTVSKARQAICSASNQTDNTQDCDCNDSPTTWAAYAKLRVQEGTYTHWCADASGVSKGQTQSQANSLLNNATSCQ